MAWGQWTDETILPGRAIDSIIHVKKYGINWNLYPRLHYSTNKATANKLLEEMNAVDLTLKNVASQSHPNVLVQKRIRSTEAVEYVVSYYSPRGKLEEQVASTYAGAVCQAFMGGEYSVNYNYEKGFTAPQLSFASSGGYGPILKGRSTQVGEWQLTPSRLRSKPYALMGTGGTYKTDPYCNVSTAVSAAGTEQKAFFYSETHTPFTTEFNKNSKATMFRFAGMHNRNYGISEITPRRLPQYTKQYYQKASKEGFLPTTNPEQFTDLRDTQLERLFENCLAYYDAYQIDFMGSDPYIMNSMIIDCCSSGSPYRVFNSWENTTINRSTPEAFFERDMSIINLNASRNVLLGNDTLYGNGFYNLSNMVLPSIRISTETINSMGPRSTAGQSDTTIPSLAWTFDANTVVADMNRTKDYDDSVIANYSAMIPYPPYQEKHNILGRHDFTIEVWCKFDELPTTSVTSGKVHILGNTVIGATADTLAGVELYAIHIFGKTKVLCAIHNGDSTTATLGPTGHVVDMDFDTVNFNYFAIQRKQDSVGLAYGDCASGWHGFEWASDTVFIDEILSNSETPITLGYHPLEDTKDPRMEYHKIRYHNKAIEEDILANQFIIEGPHTMSDALSGHAGVALANQWSMVNNNKLSRLPQTITDGEAGTTTTLTSEIGIIGMDTHSPY